MPWDFSVKVCLASLCNPLQLAKYKSIVETLYVRSYFSSVSGSSKRTLCVEVWNTFMSCIGCVPSTEKEVQGSSKELLGDEQVLVVEG